MAVDKDSCNGNYETIASRFSDSAHWKSFNNSRTRGWKIQAREYKREEFWSCFHEAGSEYGPSLPLIQETISDSQDQGELLDKGKEASEQVKASC